MLPKIVEHVFTYELEASWFVLRNNHTAQNSDDLACFEPIFTSLMADSVQK